jgi:trigger factor
MQHKLTKANQANYDLEITFTTEEASHEKGHVLKHFQADTEIKGFRKGQVPLDIVEKNVQPEYLKMSITEHIVNHGIQEMLEKNPEIKFIGEPYDYHQDDKDGTTTITLKLDVYPEVEIKKDTRKKETIKPIEVKVEDKEIDDALMNLKKNYADYQDTETLELGTVSKIALEWLDKDGNVVEKGTTYIGEPEFAETDFWKKTFVGKKKGEEFEVKYDEKTFPAVLHAKPESKPAKLKFILKDVKQQILPEFNEENILKFFGKESEVKTEAELREFIKGQLFAQKEQTALITAVEGFVSTIRKEAMSVAIPRTMIDEEFKSRIQSLEQRFGSKEKVEEYLKAMSEDQAKQFVDDIQKASTESLEKFFILNKVTELLGIDIDRNSQDQNLMVERKIYEHFNPSTEAKAEKKPVEKKTKKAE